MDRSLSLIRCVARNVRWYFEDVRTGVTGKGTLHFDYGSGSSDLDSECVSRVNPASGLPMVSKTIDAGGNPYGTKLVS